MILAINLINDWCYPLDHCLIATKKEKKKSENFDLSQVR